MWEPPNVNIIHYTVYYNSTNDIRSINFTSTATNGTINGLTNATNYVLKISATYEVSSGVYQEGSLSPSVSPGMSLCVVLLNFKQNSLYIYKIIICYFLFYRTTYTICCYYY